MYYFLSLLWASGWTRWPAKVPAEASLWFCHPCHIPLVLMLPSSRNPLCKAPSCYLRKVASDTSCVPICSWIWQHCFQDTNPNSTPPLHNSCFVHAHPSNTLFSLSSCFLRHCVQTLSSGPFAVISVNLPLFHNPLSSLPSDFPKLLLQLPLHLSPWRTIIHSFPLNTLLLFIP